MPAEIPRGQGARHDETALLSILRILLEKYENIFCFPLFSHFNFAIRINLINS